ncbi:MAG: hypothetical protein AAGF11_03060 [Myxococcota bacterium]
MVVSFTIPGPIADGTWSAFVDAITTHRPMHCLLLCAGAARVDAAQRRLSTAAFMRTGSAVVVLTDNRVTRGLAMTMAWLGAKLDAYSWNELSYALDHMQLTEDVQQRLYDIALEFHTEHRHLDR